MKPVKKKNGEEDEEAAEAAAVVVPLEKPIAAGPQPVKIAFPNRRHAERLT